MTTRSLRDARFALDADPFSATPWSLLGAIADEPWEPIERTSNGRLSVRELCRRFSNAGRVLRDIQTDGRASAWRYISRDTVVRQLRDRIRNPGIMVQNPTGLCGPFSLLFEFARRRPARYVRTAGDLLFTGVFHKPGGGDFVADHDLRQRPVPAGEVTSVDWMLAATIRDDENVSDDVDDGTWLEGITWPFELEEWIEDVLELRSNYHPCVLGGEIEALRAGQRAVAAGGVAFLLVDSAIVHQNNDDEEEDVWSRRRWFRTQGFTGWNARQHCEDDDMLFPNHYVVLLGGLENPHSETQFRVHLWSYGSEYDITGSGEGFGEYLYAVLTGRP